MSIDPFLAEILMKERVENALREAEQARLVKMVQESKGKRPFLSSIVQFIRDWWVENGRYQPTLDNVNQRKRHQNLTG